MSKRRILPLLLIVALLAGCSAKKEEEPKTEENLEENLETVLSEEQPEEVQDEKELTVTDAVEFLHGLPPSVLGLAGDSMEEYQIFPAQEVVSVDGLPCSKLFVYRVNEKTGTNVIQGVYFLSRGEERRLFMLDREKGEVAGLELPQEEPLEEPAAASEDEPPDSK